MKLSNDTLRILKNFAEINGNLTITKGNMLETVHVPPTIYAKATISEVFETNFGIYDLKEFIATLSMFKDPTLEFGEDFVTIIDDDDPTIKTKYWRTNDVNLTKIPKFKQFPDPIAKFELSEVNLKRIEKASVTLKCPDVVLEGKDGKIIARVCDLKNGTKNDFTIVLTNDYSGEEFNVHLLQEKLMIIDADYQCEMIANKLIRLTNQDNTLLYIITLDVNR